MILALAGGFHRAGQLDLALPLARQAAAKLDSTAAHLSLGDLLLAIAEGHSQPDTARKLFAQAIEEYDRVLKVVPDSIEAVNNKARILHTYLNRSQEALELVLGLRKRAVPITLPCEFFDTLGAIQEAVGQPRDAEASYLEGLKKDDKNPALNFHFGKLLAADRSRAAKARYHLSRALADRGRLNPSMAQRGRSHRAESQYRHQGELRGHRRGPSPLAGWGASRALDIGAAGLLESPRSVRRRATPPRDVDTSTPEHSQTMVTGRASSSFLFIVSLVLSLGMRARGGGTPRPTTRPVVVIDTSMGPITVALDTKRDRKDHRELPQVR